MRLIGGGKASMVAPPVLMFTASTKIIKAPNGVAEVCTFRLNVAVVSDALANSTLTVILSEPLSTTDATSPSAVKVTPCPTAEEPM